MEKVHILVLSSVDAKFESAREHTSVLDDIGSMPVYLRHITYRGVHYYLA